MSPAARDTLETYAKRMDRRYAEVLREFRGESKTKQGQLLAEMRRVELEFQRYVAMRMDHWTRRLGRFIGRALARARGR